MKYILLFIIPLCLFSQSEKMMFIEYKTSTYKNDISNNKLKTTNNSDKKFLDNVQDVCNNMIFGLYIKNNKSYFSLIENLEKDENTIKLKNILSGGTYFYDNDLKINVNSIESGGQKFNILIPEDKYKWIITKESKTINGYKCYKVTCHIDEYQKFRKRSVSFDPFVWFTPELPYSFGPKGINSLPGLILEASLNGKTFFYATQIIFDYTNPSIIIQKPKNGKDVNQNEFEDIQIKLMEDKNIKY